MEQDRGLKRRKFKTTAPPGLNEKYPHREQNREAIMEMQIGRTKHGKKAKIASIGKKRRIPKAGPTIVRSRRQAKGGRNKAVFNSKGAPTIVGATSTSNGHLGDKINGGKKNPVGQNLPSDQLGAGDSQYSATGSYNRHYSTSVWQNATKEQSKRQEPPESMQPLGVRRAGRYARRRKKEKTENRGESTGGSGSLGLTTNPVGKTSKRGTQNGETADRNTQKERGAKQTDNPIQGGKILSFRRKLNFHGRACPRTTKYPGDVKSHGSESAEGERQKTRVRPELPELSINAQGLSQT